MRMAGSMDNIETQSQNILYKKLPHLRGQARINSPADSVLHKGSPKVQIRFKSKETDMELDKWLVVKST